MAHDSLKPAVLNAVSALLTPVIPLLLELGVGVGDFETLIRRLYVDAARKMTTLDGQPNGAQTGKPRARRSRVKPATAAIAMLTGLTRAAVTKLLETGTDREADNAIGQPRAERVMTGWRHDPEFRDDSTGKPALLPMRGEGLSFTSLVKRYSGDPRVRTIRQELERVKAIRRRPDGRWELLRDTYAPASFDSDGIALVGEYARDYLRTLVHNVRQPPGLALYVRRVVNTRLDPAEVGKLHRDIALQADATMESIDAAINDPSATLSEDQPLAMRFGAGFFIFQHPATQAPATMAKQPLRRLVRKKDKR